MQLTSPRFAHQTLVPAATLVLFTGLLLASIPYFSATNAGQPRTFIDALISWLQSPAANPGGYLFATAGTALSGILLAPVAWLFYRGLSRIHRAFAAIGAGLFAAGLLAAILIGCLAPFPRIYEPLHLPLAYSVFITSSAGLAVCLAVAARNETQRRGLLTGVAALLGAGVAFLFYLLFAGDGPFDNKHWYSSLAFLEWLLCAVNAACTYLLAAVLDSHPPLKGRV